MGLVWSDAIGWGVSNKVDIYLALPIGKKNLETESLLEKTLMVGQEGRAKQTMNRCVQEIV